MNPDVWPELILLDETAEWVVLDDGTETWRITGPSGDGGEASGLVVDPDEATQGRLRISWGDTIETRQRDGDDVLVRVDPAPPK